MARKDKRPLRPRKNRAAGVFWIGLAARALRFGGMSGPQRADLLQTALRAGFAAALRRMVVLFSAQRLRQALQFRHLVFGVVGVDVAVAVAEVLHQPGGGVADDQRDGLVEHGERVALGCLVGGVDRVRARGEREVDDGVRQVYVAFRHPEEVARLVGREGDLEGAAVREADVLAREAD